jgi:Chalcone isomerase-like
MCAYSPPCLQLRVSPGFVSSAGRQTIAIYPECTLLLHFFFESNPMTTTSLRWAFIVAMLFVTQAWGAAKEVAGVKFEDTYDLAGSKLVLNGAGVRYKAVFKVYAAGLYLGQKASTPEEVTSQKGSKRMSITMLRDIDATELGKLFSRGIEDNMPRSDFSKVVPAILRMSQIFSDYKNLKTGDNFTIDWIPGTGTVLNIKGKQLGEPFKEPEFFNAMMLIWLGKSPADWKLKEALLGAGA